MLKEFGFPVLTANQSDEQPYRMVRLNQVLGYVRGVAREQGITWEIEHNLLGLNDSRGTLRVMWFFQPSHQAKDMVNTAWADQGEFLIEHWALEEDEAEQSSGSAIFRPDSVPNYQSEVMEILKSRRNTLVESVGPEENEPPLEEPTI